MITIKDFMECIDYKITEGSDFLWKCFGNDAYSLDYWNGDNDTGHSVGVTFDRKTQVVYQMTVSDYDNDRAYCWTHPDWIKQYQKESNQLGTNGFAWDDVKYIEIDLGEDILEKAKHIVQGLPYDTRVKVPVDLSKEELFNLMSLAHEKDITLNQLVEEILVEVLNREEK
jgi:hypothetical protein